jgi:hypothetical protein
MTELKKATKTIKSRVATFALQIVKTQLSCTLPTGIGIMYNDILATLLDCLRKVKINFIYLSKPLTLSVVGRGGGGPTPLANQQC